MNEIDLIREVLALDGTVLLEKMELGVRKAGRLYAGPCPVHGGDNQGALNYYPEGHTRPHWVCNTHHCEAIFGGDPLGLVWGVLSHEKCGWASPDDAMAPFREVLELVRPWFGDLEKIKVDFERKKFISMVTKLGVEKMVGRGVTRKKVRQILNVPSAYFRSREFSDEVLDKFDVGEYPFPNRPLSGRVAAPVYQDGLAVGFVGRTLDPHCEGCGQYHEPGSCPEPHGRYAKWYNHRFRREDHLYGHWHSRDFMRESGVAVLVEGPPDVWRAHEAGVFAVGLLGTDLSDGQQIQIELSGVLSVILLLDNDKPGREGQARIRQRLKRGYRLYEPELPAKDLGGMTPTEVKDLVMPYVEKASL